MAHSSEKKRHFPPGTKANPGHKDVLRAVRQDREREKFTRKKAAIEREDEDETRP